MLLITLQIANFLCAFWRLSPRPGLTAYANDTIDTLDNIVWHQKPWKVTASFSDIANAVSAEHRLWLGDAFASGDSNSSGAPGRWVLIARVLAVSLRRYFHESGTDIQKEASNVMGIDSMDDDALVVVSPYRSVSADWQILADNMSSVIRKPANRWSPLQGT